MQVKTEENADNPFFSADGLLQSQINVYHFFTFLRIIRRNINMNPDTIMQPTANAMIKADLFRVNYGNNN